MRALTVTWFCLLMACEGVIGARGRVVASDGRPVLGARVRLVLNGQRYTDHEVDADGGYWLGSLVGCVPRCPKGEVEAEAQGYQTQRAPITAGTVDVVLVPAR